MGKLFILSSVVAIIALVLFLLSLFSHYMGPVDPQVTPSAIVSHEKQTGINFKKLSSVEAVKQISQLSLDDQVLAYKEHSALIGEVEAIWINNFQDKDAQLALNRTLPILISQGWTENAARDALSWATNKSVTILDRNPEGWCIGADCKKLSDEEIKVTLRAEDKTLSEDVLNGIFEEIENDKK